MAAKPSAAVNEYYLYCVDGDFGLSLEILLFLPLNANLCLFFPRRR